MKKLSICIPCYNEEENIMDAYHRVTAVMDGLKDRYEYEIIFEDNASLDGSEAILRKLASEDKRVKVILNMRNYGVMRSGKNVCFRATGDVIITVACDLQEPPEMIPQFLEEWEKGHLIVWGQKNKSKESPIKFFLRKIYYKIICAMADSPQFYQTDGFGVIDRSVYDLVKTLDEPTMAMRHLVAELGYPVKFIPYTQEARKKGKSSYNLWSSLDFAITSLVNTSFAPLRLATVTGVLGTFFSALAGIIYLIYRLASGTAFSGVGLWVLLAVFFVGSVQLSFTGMIGEYVGAILQKNRKRPLVLERETINFDVTPEMLDGDSKKVLETIG